MYSLIHDITLILKNCFYQKIGIKKSSINLKNYSQEIIQVIRKYVTIADDQVSVQLDNNDDCSVLELNVTLPDSNN